MNRTDAATPPNAPSAARPIPGVVMANGAMTGASHGQHEPDGEGEELHALQPPASVRSRGITRIGRSLSIEAARLAAVPPY